MDDTDVISLDFPPPLTETGVVSDPQLTRLAVARTLAYSQVFASQPSRFDLWRYLHSGSMIPIFQLHSITEFAQAPTSVPNPLITAKWRAVTQATRVFALIPWIRTVWVTGALAAGSVKDDDDLDFMILTDPNRLWLSRFLLVALGLLLGRYRSRFFPQASLRNRWCCNIWLEPSALALPSSRRSLYEARELVQAVPVYCRAGERASLLLEHNRWASGFLANGYDYALRGSRRVFPNHSYLPMSWLSWPEYGLNLLLRHLQFGLMFKRITRETVRSNCAFFHPRDTRSWVKTQYETICSAKKIQPWFNAPAP